MAHGSVQLDPFAAGYFRSTAPAAVCLESEQRRFRRSAPASVSPRSHIWKPKGLRKKKPRRGKVILFARRSQGHIAQWPGMSTTIEKKRRKWRSRSIWKGAAMPKVWSPGCAVRVRARFICSCKRAVLVLDDFCGGWGESHTSTTHGCASAVSDVGRKEDVQAKEKWGYWSVIFFF